MKQLILVLTFFVFADVMAQKPAIFATRDGAIRGFDPVAYFTEGKAVTGTNEFTLVWNDQTWHFATAQNLALFKADPEKYAPQYGGYCAFGMSRGYKAETQPDAWTIVDGKLYLNYNTRVREEWKKNQAERITKADANWPSVKKQ